MPEKILYILGAGASCKALPLAKNVYDEDRNIKTEGLLSALSNIGFDRVTQFTDDINYPKMMEFQKEFQSLAKEAERLMTQIPMQSI